jgi:hypothetical protein
MCAMAMYPVYTCQFKILPHAVQTGRDCAQHILEIVETHMRQTYRDEGVKLQFEPDGAERSIYGSDRYKLTRQYFEENAELTILQWIVCRRNQIYSLDLQMARLRNQVEVTVRQRSSDWCYNANAPKVVEEILARFSAQVDDWPIADTPFQLKRADVLEFVRSYLLNAARTLPIIMISPYGGANEPLVDGFRLQREIRGSAFVAILQDAEATRNLTRSLEGNSTLSCYAGAVRIYYPGFSTTSSRIIREHALQVGAEDSIVAEQEDSLVRSFRGQQFGACLEKNRLPRSGHACNDAVAVADCFSGLFLRRVQDFQDRRSFRRFLSRW